MILETRRSQLIETSSWLRRYSKRSNFSKKHNGVAGWTLLSVETRSVKRISSLKRMMEVQRSNRLTQCNKLASRPLWYHTSLWVRWRMSQSTMIYCSIWACADHLTLGSLPPTNGISSKKSSRRTQHCWITIWIWLSSKVFTFQRIRSWAHSSTASIMAWRMRPQVSRWQSCRSLMRPSVGSIQRMLIRLLSKSSVKMNPYKDQWPLKFPQLQAMLPTSHLIIL